MSPEEWESEGKETGRKKEQSQRDGEELEGGRKQ